MRFNRVLNLFSTDPIFSITGSFLFLLILESYSQVNTLASGTTSLKTTYELEASAHSTTTSPDYVPGTAIYSQPMFRLEAGGRFYIGGSAQNFEGVNFYANGGAELIVMLNKPTYSDFDRQNYSLGFEGDVNED